MNEWFQKLAFHLSLSISRCWSLYFTLFSRTVKGHQRHRSDENALPGSEDKKKSRLNFLRADRLALCMCLLVSSCFTFQQKLFQIKGSDRLHSNSGAIRNGTGELREVLVRGFHRVQLHDEGGQCAQDAAEIHRYGDISSWPRREVPRRQFHQIRPSCQGGNLQQFGSSLQRSRSSCIVSINNSFRFISIGNRPFLLDWECYFVSMWQKASREPRQTIGSFTPFYTGTFFRKSIYCFMVSPFPERSPAMVS